LLLHNIDSEIQSRKEYTSMAATALPTAQPNDLYRMDDETHRLLVELAPLMLQWSNTMCSRKNTGDMEEWAKSNHTNADQVLSCDWYHGTWQFLRLLNMVAVSPWYGFYNDALSSVLKNKPTAKVLISACADCGMLATLHDFERYVTSSVPIGKPIFNSQVYLLDESLNPVPFGEPGEICIAGDSVGKGYINDAELTQKQFVSNPFSEYPPSRLYRTGDLGRFLPDWNLEFVGHVDHQVKLRGFHIDLSDIEATLRQHPDIKEAVVLMKGFGPSDQRLIAFLVPKNESTTREQLEDKLRPFLKEKLPEYMVPSGFVPLDKIPLNPNGKADRLALVELDAGAEGVKIGSEEPRDPVEREIASIIARTLKCDRVGIFDNFFEIGGNSFLLTEVIIPVCVNLQTNISIADFLAGPTVAQIAKRIEELKNINVSK
jgi:acyl carrier protein